MKRFTVMILSLIMILAFAIPGMAMQGQRSMCSHKQTKQKLEEIYKASLSVVYGAEVAEGFKFRIAKVRTRFENPVTKAAMCAAIVEIRHSSDKQGIAVIKMIYSVSPLDEAPNEYFVEILSAE
jgi:hypothetical protein